MALPAEQVKAPLFTMFPLAPVPLIDMAAATAAETVQVPPLLIVRLVAVTVAATLMLIVPPLLMVTVPRAFVPVALLIARIPVTLLAPDTVNATAPAVTVLVELTVKLATVRAAELIVCAPLPFKVRFEPVAVRVSVPVFVTAVPVPAIDTVMALPPSVSVLLALIERSPARVKLEPKVRVKAVVEWVSERFNNPPEIAGSVAAEATVPVKTILDVAPPVNEPEVTVIPPFNVKVKAPMLNAPLVSVRLAAVVPLKAALTDMVTPVLLLFIVRLVPAVKPKPVTCAAEP